MAEAARLRALKKDDWSYPKTPASDTTYTAAATQRIYLRYYHCPQDCSIWALHNLDCNYPLHPARQCSTSIPILQRGTEAQRVSDLPRVTQDVCSGAGIEPESPTAQTRVLTTGPFFLSRVSQHHPANMLTAALEWPPLQRMRVVWILSWGLVTRVPSSAKCGDGFRDMNSWPPRHAMRGPAHRPSCNHQMETFNHSRPGLVTKEVKDSISH